MPAKVFLQGVFLHFLNKQDFGSHLRSNFRTFKTIVYIQTQGNWVSCEFKARDGKRRFFLLGVTLERYKKKLLLHQIVTGDEK